MFAAELFSQQVRARKRLLAQRPGRGRAIGRIPRQQQPDRQRELYYGRLRPIVGFTFDLIDQRLRPDLDAIVRDASVRRDGLREDNWFEALDEKVRDVSTEFLRTWPQEKLRAVGEAVANATSDFQRGQLLQQFRSALSVDPVLLEPWLPDEIRTFAAQNARLIQTMVDDTLNDVQTRVVTAVRQGNRALDIAAELVEAHGVTDRRARVIARDQVGKLTADLNRSRQQELGVDGYLWRGKLDNRERPLHRAREGQRFTWDKPPSDGHPGVPVLCRCEAEPDLQGYWEKL